NNKGCWQCNGQLHARVGFQTDGEGELLTRTADGKLRRWKPGEMMIREVNYQCSHCSQLAPDGHPLVVELRRLEGEKAAKEQAAQAAAKARPLPDARAVFREEINPIATLLERMAALDRLLTEQAKTLVEQEARIARLDERARVTSALTEE